MPLPLLGETIRDIGILVVVFGPLDAFFQNERPGAGLSLGTMSFLFHWVPSFAAAVALLVA